MAMGMGMGMAMVRGVFGRGTNQQRHPIGTWLTPDGDVVAWSRGSRGVLPGVDGRVGKGIYKRPGR
jgi:hypothetical protein